MIRNAVVALAIPLAAITLGCPRRAPGPVECEHGAFSLLGVRDPRVLRDPRVKAFVDEFTVECLTTPYDRSFLECVEQTGAPDACYEIFKQRRQIREAPRTKHPWTLTGSFRVNRR